MPATDAASATEANIKTIESLYTAFGRGDIPGILEMLAEDVRWEDWADNFAQRAAVPWLVPRKGREGAAEFFAIVGTLEIAEFEVLSMLAGGNQVAVEIVIDARPPGGGRFRDEELHLWSFNEAGQIERLRHYTDTAKHIAAARGEDTTAA